MAPGGTLETGLGDEAYLCVAAEPFRDEVFLARPSSQGEVPVVFHPREDAADCRSVDGAELRSTADETALLVLVLDGAPREVSAPAVYRIDAVGGALWVPRPSDQAELGVLLDDAAQEVVLVDGASLEVLGTAAEPGEMRFAFDAPGAYRGHGVFVVYTASAGDGSVLVDWVDPVWYPSAPSLGHVAVVVAVALFMMLWHGRRPRVEG